MVITMNLLEHKNSCCGKGLKKGGKIGSISENKPKELKEELYALARYIRGEERQMERQERENMGREDENLGVLAEELIYTLPDRIQDIRSSDASPEDRLRQIDEAQEILQDLIQSIADEENYLELLPSFNRLLMEVLELREQIQQYEIIAGGRINKNSSCGNGLKKGRPSKYKSQEEAKKAKAEQDKARYDKKKQEKLASTTGGSIMKKIGNIVKTTKEKIGDTNKRIETTTKEVIYGATDLPRSVKEILNKYGNEPIKSLTLMRTPVPKVLTGALSLFSGGEFGKKMEQNDFDTLFHLFLEVGLVSGKKIQIEKNERINMKVNAASRPHTETRTISGSGVMKPDKSAIIKSMKKPMLMATMTPEEIIEREEEIERQAIQRAIREQERERQRQIQQRMINNYAATQENIRARRQARNQPPPPPPSPSGAGITDTDYLLNDKKLDKQIKETVKQRQERERIARQALSLRKAQEGIQAREAREQRRRLEEEQRQLQIRLNELTATLRRIEEELERRNMEGQGVNDKKSDKQIQELMKQRRERERIKRQILALHTAEAARERREIIAEQERYESELRELFDNDDVDYSLEDFEADMGNSETAGSGFSKTGLTLNTMMTNTEREMGRSKFLGYSAKDNNCQDWLVAVLKSNNIGSGDDISFIKQNTKELFEGLPYLRKLSNTLTNIGAKANAIISGGGINNKKMKGKGGAPSKAVKKI